MARLFWLLVILCVVAAVVAGASWAMAYNSVSTLLGAPPPKMGTQSTRVVWHGLTHNEKHAYEWRFAFGPTAIPGAPRVAIYVAPAGQVIRTEPADLKTRLAAFHNTGY
jgi:hypothetical protein